MKTKALLTFISILISTTLFSQNEIISKIDTTVLNESISNYLDELNENKKLKEQTQVYKLPEFKSQFNDSFLQKIPKGLDTAMLSLKSPQPIDNMPIVKPGGEFNMPVMVPDTSVHYFIQNNKIGEYSAPETPNRENK